MHKCLELNQHEELLRHYSKHTMCLIHMDVRKPEGYSDGEIRSPWILRCLFGLDTLVFQVIMYNGRM